MTTTIPRYACPKCKKVYALPPSPDGSSIYDEKPHPDIGKCLECKVEVMPEHIPTSWHNPPNE